MIIQTCPDCGADLEQQILTSNPPKRKVRCPMCGWEHTETEETIRIPYVCEDRNMIGYVPPACKNCSNHPSNGGTGICHCILGTTQITC